MVTWGCFDLENILTVEHAEAKRGGQIPGPHGAILGASEDYVLFAGMPASTSGLSYVTLSVAQVTKVGVALTELNELHSLSAIYVWLGIAQAHK